MMEVVVGREELAQTVKMNCSRLDSKRHNLLSTLMYCHMALSNRCKLFVARLYIGVSSGSNYISQVADSPCRFHGGREREITFLLVLWWRQIVLIVSTISLLSYNWNIHYQVYIYSDVLFNIWKKLKKFLSSFDCLYSTTQNGKYCSESMDLFVNSKIVQRKIF